jgi:hypothetical protein
MMGTKIRNFAPLPEDISLENLVPEEHFYRRLEARLDLSFVRELVEPLYAGAAGPLWTRSSSSSGSSSCAPRGWVNSLPPRRSPQLAAPTAHRPPPSVSSPPHSMDRSSGRPCSDHGGVSPASPRPYR